ncbi:MAG TPA: hypothetical protein V6D08_04610, partial [Candidatus Obscuribacterales bacterium]
MSKVVLWLGAAAAIGAFSVGYEALAYEQQWYGYVIDRQCAESFREDTDPRAFVLHHTKACALMPNCRAKGYALFVDGKWYDFDKRGNELAVKLLQTSKRKKGFYVQVTAEARGRVLI